MNLLQQLLPNKTKKVIETNLDYCLSDLTASERLEIRNKNIKYNIELFAEIIYVWFHSYPQNRKLIKSVNGLEKFKRALDDDKGMLVISPHFGNWELVWSYLCNEFESAG